MTEDTRGLLAFLFVCWVVFVVVVTAVGGL